MIAFACMHELWLTEAHVVKARAKQQESGSLTLALV